jgi:hypothetical protein
MTDWLPIVRPVYAYVPQLRQSRHLYGAELGWTGERGRTLAVRGVCDGRRYVVPLALVVGGAVQYELAKMMEEADE